MDNGIQELIVRLRCFAQSRDWGQFHSPKNLACALSVEAAELLEHFQWMTEEQSDLLTGGKLAAVESEMADVFNYLLYLSDRLNIDLVEAASKKLLLNEERYPVDKAKGRSNKYNEL